ncbi:MAG TPA: MBL fold metallo-hydrolase [Ktedonobacteraceae bacterium]|nr:MBL fold metallo-hydrolase [Ktedonobacteraceae bacterium]
MQHWMCITCGTQFAESENQPETCPICADQRQYIGPGGQKWTTLEAMQGGNYKNSFKEYEPNVTGIGTEPAFAIGQRALLVQTGHGNVLWDCISYVDDETVAALQQRGGLKAIAISHPHFFTTMVEWAERFDVPIYLHEALRRHVMRPSERITFWSGETHALMDDITLLRLGGHFTGSTVLHWQGGADGKGLLLTGDTIQVVPDRNWVSFMYSYPNMIPLPASEIRRMRDAIMPYNFERLYGMRFESVVAPDAKNAVLRSADRYIRALSERL